MEPSLRSSRRYRFNFWKDRFWIWALVLPFGLICWVLPFIIFFGLLNTRNSPDWFPLFGFLFLGLPGYLVGWIFVYSFMEGIYTRVTIAENWISIRLPWLLFPVFPVVKRIEINEIRRADLFARYGSRTAVFLYYDDRGKERHFYLPMLQYDPAYKQEMFTLKKRVEADYPAANAAMTAEGSETQAKLERLQTVRSRIHLRPNLFERFVRFLYFIILIGIFVVSCWIASNIPPGGITAVEIGFSVAFAFSLLGLLGLLPVIGQVLFWLFGRFLIASLSGLLFHISTDSVLWSTPGSVNQILARFNLPPIQASYTDFLFWSILVFSILVSLDCTIGWLRRRAINRKD